MVINNIFIAIAALFAVIFIFSLIMMIANIIKKREDPSEKVITNIKMYFGMVIAFGALFLVVGFVAFFLSFITYQVMNSM